MNECSEWKFCNKHPCLVFNASALEINCQEKENEVRVPKFMCVSWNLYSCISLLGFSTHRFTHPCVTPSKFGMLLWNSQSVFLRTICSSLLNRDSRGISPSSQVLVDGMRIRSLTKILSAPWRVTTLPSQGPHPATGSSSQCDYFPG